MTRLHSEYLSLLERKTSKIARFCKLLTKPLVLTCLANLFGPIQMGYNLTISSNTQDVVKAFMNITITAREGKPPSDSSLTNIWALTVSIFLLGGAVGAVGSKWLSDKCGRKNGLLYNAILGIFSVPFFFLSRLFGIWELLLVGRFVVGVHSGLYTVLVPVYLAEISPKEIRGAVSSLTSIGMATAIFLSEVVGFPMLLGTAHLWPIAYGLILIPCLLQLLLLPFSVESPTYLLMVSGDVDQARIALQQLRQSSDVEDEIEALQDRMDNMKESISVKELFRHAPYRRPMVLAILSHMTFQMTGVNAVLPYSNSLFQEAAGLSPAWASYASSFIGALAIVSSILTALLMDVAGRRTLQLAGLVGLIVCTSFATFCLVIRSVIPAFGIVAILFLILFVVFFRIGPATITWVITGEYFPQEAKSVGSAIAVMVNWLLGFLINYSFPPLEKVLGAYVLLPYTVFMVAVCIFFYFRMPETKDKTMEEITAIFQTPYTYEGSQESLPTLPDKVSKKS